MKTINKKAFSLIEVMICVALLSIVVSIASLVMIQIKKTEILSENKARLSKYENELRKNFMNLSANLTKSYHYCLKPNETDPNDPNYCPCFDSNEDKTLDDGSLCSVYKSLEVPEKTDDHRDSPLLDIEDFISELSHENCGGDDALIPDCKTYEIKTGFHSIITLDNKEREVLLTSRCIDNNSKSNMNGLFFDKDNIGLSAYYVIKKLQIAKIDNSLNNISCCNADDPSICPTYNKEDKSVRLFAIRIKDINDKYDKSDPQIKTFPEVSNDFIHSSGFIITEPSDVDDYLVSIFYGVNSCLFIGVSGCKKYSSFQTSPSASYRNFLNKDLKIKSIEFKGSFAPNSYQIHEEF